MTDDSFDNIVAGFYQAASGACDWVTALLPFQRALSAFAVYMHAVDSTRGQVVFGHNASDTRAETELDYIRTYHRIDPRAELVLRLPPGQWMHCWEHFDDRFVADDPFYQEFLIPYGGRYVSAVKLLQDDAIAVMLGVHRGIGSPRLNDAEIQTCKRLARHLTDALLVHRHALKQRQQGRLGIELLMRLRVPVALVDEQRRLWQANPAAEVLFATNHTVVRSGGRLHCRRSIDENALSLALRRLLCRDETRSDGKPPTRLFLRASPPGGDLPLGIYLSTLHPQNTLYAFGEQALVMLMFHETGRHLDLDPFVVAAAYDLTPAEARVAVAAARGASPDQIARAHRVSTHTVRSQLQAIFHKTGTSRQAELVGLLASLPVAAMDLGKT